MKSPQRNRRSNCPISFALDALGDKWTLLVLRDILLLGKRHYGEFLQSEEGIATNILADRLRRLEEVGIIRKTADAENLTKYLYTPTEIGIDLVPVVVELARWGATHDPKTGAPREFLQRYRRDRAGLIAETISNARDPTGASTAAQTARCRPGTR